MRPRDDEKDRGSLSVELVIVIPMLLLLVGLVFAYGRVAQVNGTLEAGVRDAARAATQARNATDARDRADEVIRGALGPGATDCLATLQVDPIGVFTPGLPITVSASCQYPMSDIGLPGMPGSVSARATFTSPLDPNRGVR